MSTLHRLPCGTPTTLAEAFQNIVRLDPEGVAVRTPGNAIRITWADYARRVRELAGGLAGLGVRPGDTVGILLTNRPEFHLIDTAALHVGAIPFSIYNTLAPEQLAYVLDNASARVIITEPRYLETIAKTGAELDHIVCLDDEIEGTVAFDALPGLVPAEFDFESRWRAVAPDDVCTLIYTSGTTGSPKGVELTHASLLAECVAFDQVVEVRPGDRITSYLPSAHVADRLSAHYLQMTHGVQTTDIADLSTIAEALPDVRPTIWLAVPRVWDKMRFRIEAAIDQAPSPLRRELGRRALSLAIERVRAEQAGRRIAPHKELLWRLADLLVLSKVRATLGFDELRWGISGAAAISPDTLEFFLAIGIRVCEVWGMTETSAGTTINPPDAIRIGTVGKPVPTVELKLAEDGELLLRGPMMMRGYRNDPERTREVLSADGWLSTGDIGTVDADGYVTIVDRKKELIINAAGKNMSPTNIENTIKSECPVAATVVVIGDSRPYNVALIVLDQETAVEIAATHGRELVDAADLAADPAVLAAVEAGVTSGNARLARVEQIKKFTVLPAFWEPGGAELTPTLKLRRKPISTKYAAEIEELYA
ncbi:AMP-binding protein [Nocardia sp. NPDC058518]|uniref:AMP-binding protein n=1 Tax=Nocardia sp. NPDC058518 TaxID=3346534 RepID=UPI00366270D1